MIDTQRFMIDFNPNGITENNLSARVWLALTIAGFKVYLEYTHENCRFDCVVVNRSNQIFAIIEVKRFTNKPLKHLRSNLYRKQFVKYNQFDTPVLLINNSKINWLNELSDSRKKKSERHQ